jgi:DnaJ-class molecular chaperone
MEKTCKKCLGERQIFNGKKIVTCNLCNGTGKTHKKYNALDDDEIIYQFGDDELI